MAVELMSGFRNNSFPSKMEENTVQVQEAATAGLESVEKLIRLLSQSRTSQNIFQEDPSSSKSSSDYQAVADAAVHKFKKFISLLDRTRTGHARFRRGPITTHAPAPPPPPPPPSQQPSVPMEDDKEKVLRTTPRIYCPTPIQGLPPLPHSHHQLVKNATVERKESSSTTINFAAAAAASPVNSFMSSLTGDTESLQPSMSSGFQITNLSSHVSSAGKPPLSTSSFKRKCSSMDGGGASSGGRCHCPKKR